MASSTGYIYSITAAFFSGACVGVGKIILTDGDPQTLVLYLFITAIPINLVWWLFHRQPDELSGLTFNGYLWIVLQAGLSVTAILTLWYGVKLIDPTVASFLSRFEVLMVVLLGIWLFRERFNLIEAIGGMLILTGLLIIRYNAGIAVSAGMMIILTSAVLFGFSELVAKRIVRTVSPGLLALLRNCHILLFVFILTLIKGNYQYSELGKYHYLFPLAGLLGPALGRPIYLHALKHLEVSKVAMVNQVQPIPVAIVAYFALGMIPTVKEWIGGLTIIAGCFLMIRGRSRQ
ncbi:MAG: EamA family transporter [candidate division Zixibacteria bacterium]|nr:EamA family transporter [candidate division Zixibacteria bacterium]